jgi:hypothetical protein
MSAGEKTFADQIRGLAKNPELVEAVRKMMENELIDMRDRGMAFGLHANGLTVKNPDGSPSSVIRMGTGLSIVMILENVAAQLD